jgi:IS5 family transposase
VVDLVVFKGNPPDSHQGALRPGTASGHRRPRLRRGERRAGSRRSRGEEDRLSPQRKAGPGAPSGRAARGFRSLIKWRTGSEGRISHLKHSWGLDRSLLDGIAGATIWCGWGVLAHNTAKITALSEKKNEKATEDRHHRPREEQQSTGPPTGRSPTPSRVA